MNPRTTGAVALLGWSAMVLAWVFLPGQTGLSADPARLLVVGSYLFAAPGGAFVMVLALRDKLLAAVVAMGFSGALLVVLAQASLYLHIWSPVGTAVTVIGSTCAMSLTVLARETTSRSRLSRKTRTHS